MTLALDKKVKVFGTEIDMNQTIRNMQENNPRKNLGILTEREYMLD